MSLKTGHLQSILIEYNFPTLLYKFQKITHFEVSYKISNFKLINSKIYYFYIGEVKNISLN